MTLQELRDLHKTHQHTKLHTAATSFLKTTATSADQLEARYYQARSSPEADQAVSLLTLLVAGSGEAVPASASPKESEWVRRGREDLIQLHFLRESYQLALLQSREYLGSYPQSTWREPARLLECRCLTLLQREAEAATCWEKLSTSSLSEPARQEALLGSGDAAFHAGDLSKAEALYNLVPPEGLSESFRLRLALRLQACSKSKKPKEGPPASSAEEAAAEPSTEGILLKKLNR